MASPPTPCTAYLALGSNLGDRLAAMRGAVRALCQHPHIHVNLEAGVASLYETSPVGVPPGRPAYLNSAVRVETTLSPDGLLSAVLSMEASLGRVRSTRWEDRLIDIDLLLFCIDVCLFYERIIRKRRIRIVSGYV